MRRLGVVAPWIRCFAIGSAAEAKPSFTGLGGLPGAALPDQ